MLLLLSFQSPSHVSHEAFAQVLGLSYVFESVISVTSF